MTSGEQMDAIIKGLESAGLRVLGVNTPRTDGFDWSVRVSAVVPGGKVAIHATNLLDVLGDLPVKFRWYVREAWLEPLPNPREVLFSATVAAKGEPR